MTTLFPKTAAIILFFAVSVLAAPAQNSDAGKDPYLTFAGTAYPWPKEAMPMFTLERRISVDENQCPISGMHIVGGGVDLGVGDLRPFYVPTDAPAIPSGLEKSLILYDSNVRSGLVAFTRFAREAFFPDLDKDAVMGYAKALKTSSGTGSVTIDIIDGPTEPERKQMILSCRPIMLTWKATNATNKTSTTRTDMFVKMDDGSIVVVSVISDTASFSGVWAESMEMLRYSGFVKSGE